MSQPRQTDTLQVTTELSLFGVTAASIVGMHLLFRDGSFFGPLVLQALVAHITMAVLRRMRLRLLPAALVTVGVAILFVTWSQYLDSTVALLPTPDTLSSIDADMDQAWLLFQDVRAPAPVVPGFIVTTSLAVWVIVFIADWGAFRTGVSFEALLPPATLFLFAAVLGEEGGTRAPGATLFVAAALVFLLLHRTWRQEGSATWAAVNFQRGRWSVLSAGTTLAAIPVIAAGILGPNLPGADDPPIVPWRNMNKDDEARVVVSPLVDIRSRLVDQSNVEVFTVHTDDPNFEGAYWRLTALDSFDGTIWRSSYDTDDADGELPQSVEDNTPTTRVEQIVRILALDAIWLPAAYKPVALETRDDETKVDYDKDSATLIVDKDIRTSDGLTYTVTSEVPAWTGDQLRTAPTRLPEEIADRYLKLPDDFSEDVRNEAARITADADTPYDKAIELMLYLKAFEYDDQTVAGHSEDALEDFLFVRKAGYCEQFAASFAAMARSLGIPSRVAVGFTQGQQDRNERRLFRVTGKQAHAWVEVYFEGFGWVTFDPTPGRAPNGAQGWLGLDPEQAGTGDSNPGENTTPGDASPGPETPAAPPDAGLNQGDVTAGAADVPSPASNEDNPGFVPPAIKDAARPLAWAVLAYLTTVPFLLFVLPRLRRFFTKAPKEKIDLAWREATQEASESGVKLSDSLTVAERALRMRSALPDIAEEIDLVARWVEQVHYAEITPTPEQAQEAAKAATAIVTAAARRQLWYVRLLRYLDARRLIPQPDRARRSAHGAMRTARTA